MASIEIAFKTYIPDPGLECRDSYLYRDNLYIVAEGIGESQEYDIEKEYACHIISESFFKHLKEHHSPASAIEYGVGQANIKIFHLRKELDKKITASVSIIYVGEKVIYFTHLGDSRIYSIQKGEIRQLTKDHTLAQDTPHIKNRDTSPRQALIDGLGFHEKRFVDIKKYPIPEKGIIMLTTEGLTRGISNREIQRLSSKSRNPEIFCDDLFDLAIKKGKPTCMTVGILRFGRLRRDTRKIILINVAFLLITMMIVAGYFIGYHGNDLGMESVPVEQEMLKEKNEPKFRNKTEREPPAKKKFDNSLIFSADQGAGVSLNKKEEQTKPIKEITKKQQDTEQIDQILRFVSDWKSAWEKSAGSHGNLDRYFSFYSTKFRSKNLDKDGWRKDKSRKNRKKIG